MDLREHISDILGAQVLFANAGREKFTKKRWQEILRHKEDFLSNRVKDPGQSPFMDRDVAASWMRSRQMGVNPHTVVTIPDRNKLAEIKVKHHQLIQVVNVLINPFKEVMLSQGYLLYLFDRSGLILMNEGVWAESPEIVDQTSRSGILADEKSQGTSAHELCFRLKRPVQLLGPEHYCAAFQNRIASAAPIIDDSGDAVAALVILSPPLLEPVEDHTINNLYLHTMGLVTSLSVAAETQLKLHENTKEQAEAAERMEVLQADLQAAREKMVSVHRTLTASLAFIDEGMVAVDSTGRILQINNEAIRILKVRPEETGNRNIREFLSEDSTLLKTAMKGESFTTEECVKVGAKKPQAYRICVRPVLNQYTKALDVVVLKFVSHEKLLTRINSSSTQGAGYTFTDIAGDSRELKAAIVQAQRFAGTSENILLIGESGTGKELFAQSIHNHYRSQGPFMAVNCAAMPRELVGSELFGYEGGSFTGAERCGKPGKIELAHGGTLFLDEIGDMPLEHQAILLRTLQDKKVMRVGGNRYKEVDFRLLAATNKDLAKMVRENTFREDLFYRISVLTVYIPPLRKRGADVELLSRSFIESYCRKHGWDVPCLSPEALNLLLEYSWPGNVRQLQNAIHHAINTIVGDTILPGDLPHYVFAETGPVAHLEDLSHFGNSSDNLSLRDMEKMAIEAALLRSNNCIPTAAEVVGVSRSTMYRKLKEYKIPVN